MLQRDTFSRVLNFWLFLRLMTLNDGPFKYVLGRYRLDSAHLLWEQVTANAAIKLFAQANLGVLLGDTPFSI